MDLVSLIALAIQMAQCSGRGSLLSTLGTTVDRYTLRPMTGAVLLPLNTLAHRVQCPLEVGAYLPHVTELNLYNLLQIPIIIRDLCSLLLVVTTLRFHLNRMEELIRSEVDRFKATRSQCSAG